MELIVLKNSCSGVEENVKEYAWKKKKQRIKFTKFELSSKGTKNLTRVLA